jgi:hypothetical protein
MLLNANPLMEQVPVVILASGDQEQRRRALRQGLTDLVFPPYEVEEVILTTRVALERDRDKRPLFGSVSQLSIPDLLQTVEVGRRTGTIVLRRRGAKGTIWFKDGVIVDGEIDDDRSGEEAVYAMAMWTEGTFEADFRPVAVPSRLSLVPSVMLLEAMHRYDEETRYLRERAGAAPGEMPEEEEYVEPPEAVEPTRVVPPVPPPPPPEVLPRRLLPGDAVTVHLALACSTSPLVHPAVPDPRLLPPARGAAAEPAPLPELASSRSPRRHGGDRFRRPSSCDRRRSLRPPPMAARVFASMERTMPRRFTSSDCRADVAAARRDEGNGILRRAGFARNGDQHERRPRPRVRPATARLPVAGIDGRIKSAARSAARGTPDPARLVGHSSGSACADVTVR